MTKLEAEALDLLKEIHTELLDRFAGSKRNKLRVEIRYFRGILKELESWARQRGFVTLADKARWWEWYWFEREYGDSQFEDVTENCPVYDSAIEPRHLSQYTLLRAYALNPKVLAHDIQQAAAMPYSSIIPGLCGPSSESTWDDLNELLKNARPNLQRRLVTALESAIRRWNPATGTRQFFEFITKLPRTLNISVRPPKWHDNLSNISVIVVTRKGQLERVGSGAFNPSTCAWLIDQEVCAESRRDVLALKADLLSAA